MPRDDERREKSVRCSFCGKTDGQVEKIIAGPGVDICNECIDRCSAIMAEEMENDGQLAGQLVVWTTLISSLSIFIIVLGLKAVGLL